MNILISCGFNIDNESIFYLHATVFIFSFTSYEI